MCKSVEGRADWETGASRDFSAIVADEIAGEQVIRASQIMDDIAEDAAPCGRGLVSNLKAGIIAALFRIFFEPKHKRLAGGESLEFRGKLAGVPFSAFDLGVGPR